MNARITHLAVVAGILYAALFVLFLAGGVVGAASGEGSAGVIPAVIFGPLVVVFIAAVYLAPSIVAYVRQHDNMIPIVIVNVTIGWSGIFWVAALVWSFMYQRPTVSRFS